MPLSGEYAPSPWDWSREHADKYAETGGAEGADINGARVILLTTLGAKTGKLRKTPLMRVEHDGEYALVASMGGAPKHPVWYHNLVADPQSVTLQDGDSPMPVKVRELEGDERARWWERAVAAYPPYAEYQERTTRRIPVFLATPVN